MSRNLRVGAANYGGSVIIPIDGKNPENLPIGSIVALDAKGDLKSGTPALGVLTGMSVDGYVSVGISGVFNVVGISGAIGTKPSAIDGIIMSNPFDGFSVDAVGKKTAVKNIVMIKI